MKREDPTVTFAWGSQHVRPVKPRDAVAFMLEAQGAKEDATQNLASAIHEVGSITRGGSVDLEALMRSGLMQDRWSRRREDPSARAEVLYYVHMFLSRLAGMVDVEWYRSYSMDPQSLRRLSFQPRSYVSPAASSLDEVLHSLRPGFGMSDGLRVARDRIFEVYHAVPSLRIPSDVKSFFESGKDFFRRF